MATSFAFESADAPSVASASFDTAPEAAILDTTAPPEEAIYYAPHALTKLPRVQGIVDIPFPEGLAHNGHYASKLNLYIDETGTVRKVEVAAGELPPPLIEAARHSFMQASFKPGEQEGRPVKSLITVEVVFDDTMPATKQQAATDGAAGPA